MSPVTAVSEKTCAIGRWATAVRPGNVEGRRRSARGPVPVAAPRLERPSQGVTAPFYGRVGGGEGRGTVRGRGGARRRAGRAAASPFRPSCVTPARRGGRPRRSSTCLGGRGPTTSHGPSLPARRGLSPYGVPRRGLTTGHGGPSSRSAGRGLSGTAASPARGPHGGGVGRKAAAEAGGGVIAGPPSRAAPAVGRVSAPSRSTAFP